MLFPVLKNEKDILNKLRENIPLYSKNYLCFFSSHLKAFVTDPLFMTIPLEDKMIHRGYAVFETTKIFGNNIYQLDKHIQRLLTSIKYINLKSMYTHEDYREILMKMAFIARQLDPDSDIEIRYYYTAGLGNLNIIVNDNLHSFYAIAYKTDYSIRPLNGVNERTVYIQELRESISHSKNTNYLLNVLVAKISREQGGYLGIMTDEDGNLLESPISNIAFVLSNGEFSVPSFEKTLVGTTVVRCMEYVEKELIPNGLITKISRDYVNIKDLNSDNIKEIMLVGGDFVIPVLKINDFNLNNGPGEITKLLQNFLMSDKISNEVSEEIVKFDI
jgi:branched-subunit amino acid aminotransferase/4-amino-4-deoxychorismate lyase